MILRYVFLTLAAASTLHTTETVFKEDFERFSPDALLEEGPNGIWHVIGFNSNTHNGTAVVVQGTGSNISRVARITPTSPDEKPSATSTSIFAHYPEVSGKIRFETRLYAENGAGQVLLRHGKGKNAITPIYLLFRLRPKVELVAYGPNGSENTISLGPYKHKKWYRLVIQADTDKQQYDLELIDAESGTSEISVTGLEFYQPATTLNGLILGAIFGASSVYLWDDVVIAR